MKTTIYLTLLLSTLCASAQDVLIPIPPTTVTNTVSAVRLQSVQFGILPVYVQETNAVFATNEVVSFQNVLGTNDVVTMDENGNSVTNQEVFVSGQIPTGTNYTVSTNYAVSVIATNYEFWAAAQYQQLGPSNEVFRVGVARYSQAELVAASPDTNFMANCQALLGTIGDSPTLSGRIVLNSLTGSNRVSVITQYAGSKSDGTRRLNERGLHEDYGVNVDSLVELMVAMTRAAVEQH